MFRRFLVRVVLNTILFVLLGFNAMPALAQQWPQRPLRLIVPYAPGGGTDVVARVLAQTMSDQ